MTKLSKQMDADNQIEFAVQYGKDDPLALIGNTGNAGHLPDFLADIKSYPDGLSLISTTAQ